MNSRLNFPHGIRTNGMPSFLSVIVIGFATVVVVLNQPCMRKADAQEGLGSLVEAANQSGVAPQQLPETMRRSPLPSAAATKQAMSQIKDIFRDEYAKATTPQTRVSLGRQLLGQAEKTPDPAERWALTSEAMRLAADAGEMDLCFAAIDGASSHFAINADEFKLDALTKLAAKAPPQSLDSLSRAALALAKKAAESGDSQSASKSVTLALGLARKTKNRTLMGEVTKIQQSARDEDREARELAGVQAKLASNPDDPSICLEAGRFFCFKAGEWDRGLPLLAKGSDTELARLAVAESNSPKTPQDMISLGDAWWDWSEKERGTAKTAGLAHAADLYASVVTKLQGLDRTRLEKRIKQARSESPDRGKRIALADLQEESATGMQYGFTKDGTFKGKPFTCRGQQWPKALQAMTTPNGTTIKYKVPAGAKRLIGKAGVFGPEGVGATQHPDAPIHFEIIVDGHSAWKSEPLARRDDTANFQVELLGAVVVELHSKSNSPASAWSAWLDPEFVY